MLKSLAFNNETLLYNNQYELYYPDPYNPLNLPSNTVRVRTSDGNVPTKGANTSYETATLVPGTVDVYDVYKSGTSFDDLLADSNNVVEVLGANTTNITNMHEMFYNCTSLTFVPLFNTSNVWKMARMFHSCASITTVPSFDTSNVTTMEFMFYNCTSLISVPLFDTSSVTNMKHMFYNCTSLTTVPLFNTFEVTDMRYMLANCTSLTKVPLFMTSKVTNMYGMLMRCTSLTAVPTFYTSNVTNMTQMLFNCINVRAGALALYNQASTQATPPSGHSQTFYECGANTVQGAAELAQIPSDWK